MWSPLSRTKEFVLSDSLLVVFKISNTCSTCSLSTFSVCALPFFLSLPHYPFYNLPSPRSPSTVMYRVCLVCGGGHMFSLRLKFLLSCLRSEARGELGPFVARLPGRRRGAGGGKGGRGDRRMGGRRGER